MSDRALQKLRWVAIGASWRCRGCMSGTVQETANPQPQAAHETTASRRRRAEPQVQDAQVWTIARLELDVAVLLRRLQLRHLVALRTSDRDSNKEDTAAREPPQG